MPDRGRAAAAIVAAVLAFSGGGTRAAAFSYSVLEDKSESGPGIVGQLLKASGVPIDRYSYEQVELLKDMIDRWALMRDRSRLAGLEGWPADPSLTELPKMEFCPIDVSFERIADPERRRRFMSLPTSFVLPPDDVDALREVAGELLRENAVYRKLVRDLGGTPAP